MFVLALRPGFRPKPAFPVKRISYSPGREALRSLRQTEFGLQGQPPDAAVTMAAEVLLGRLHHRG